MSDKVQLVITALQQRIGEIVSNYETQIAVLRAELTQAVEQINNTKKEADAKFEAAEAYSEELESLGE
jgi:chromosome condensin MukBEF ATPase and DNA-binding subunit MukB